MSDFIILLIIIGLKIFLFQTTPSTDFEVHRNWKAITNSLPINQWYFFSKNKWTLDYPPLFAYMEYFFGKISKYFDENITSLDKQNYSSNVCQNFMRATVLIGDFFLFFSLKKLCKNLNLKINQCVILLLAIQLNAGLVIVDNIHFQYNGILFGLLFFSISFIAEKKYVLGAMFYFICVCMKHLFLYFAPAYCLFYFHYIIIKNIKKKKFKKLFTKVFLIILGFGFVFGLTFLPFLIISYKEKNLTQLIQIKERLFPLKRGLLHSYWAPNFWALYSTADKLLYFFHNNKEIKINFIEKICNYLLKYKKDINIRKNISSTGAGVTGVSSETGFDILPDIDIKTTNIIIISFLLIYILKFWYKKSHEKQEKNKNTKIKELIQHCIFSNLIFFNFGYQVHEKAFLNIALLAIIYYVSFVYVVEKNNNKMLSYTDSITSLTLIITLIGILAQLPLVNDTKDYLVKIGLTLLYFIFCNVKLFNKGDFNSDISTKLLIIFVLCIGLVLDFFITFQNHADYNVKALGIKYLEKLNDKYPFAFLLTYSCLNSVYVQTILLLLFLA